MPKIGFVELSCIPAVRAAPDIGDNLNARGKKQLEEVVEGDVRMTHCKDREVLNAVHAVISIRSPCASKSVIE